jgi:hypothetical protein
MPANINARNQNSVQLERLVATIFPHLLAFLQRTMPARKLKRWQQQVLFPIGATCGLVPDDDIACGEEQAEQNPEGEVSCPADH